MIEVLSVRALEVTGNHQGRPAIALNYTRRCDSNDSAVPAVTVNYHAVGITKSDVFGDALLDCVHDAAFFFLALTVELVEPSGDFASTLGLFCAEEINNIARDVHASSGVDAGGYAE